MTKHIYGVIGANYGDEGKGRVTDYLCHQHNGTKIVVCTNGGAQRGHTVVTDAIRHVFHHYGSGTLTGADTYFAKTFILNPVMFLDEGEELRRKGISKPMCFAHHSCKVTFVYDMLVNQIVELSRDQKHGSCGCGIWETLQRYDAGYDKTIGEFYFLANQDIKEYLAACRNFSRQRILDLLHSERLPLDVYAEYAHLFEDEALLNCNVDSINEFLNTVKIVPDSSFLQKYDTVVFENGQGLLLDRRIDKQLSTPSITGSEVIAEIIADNFPIANATIKLYYITRTYITRHGHAQFKEKCDKADINPEMIDETNQPNPFQGALRYGQIIFDELYRRIQRDAAHIPTAEYILAVTHTNDYPWQGERYENMLWFN